MKSLAIKYRPSTFEELTEQTTIAQILTNQVKSNSFKHAYLFTGPAGTGKAQPLYSKILTPDGFITMGDVKIGQEVFTDKGNIGTVSEIYPQGKRDIYEITLQDQTKIRVADNHLNCVYRYNKNKKQREDYVLETTDLINLFNTSRYKLRMDTPCVNWEKQDVLINPYLLGVLLGDGNLSGSSIIISNSEQDLLDKINDIVQSEYNMYLKHITNYDYTIQYCENPKHNGSKGNRGLHELKRNYDPLTTLVGQIKHYNLNCKSIYKHIPKEYLYNTKEVRLALLQGLFDTDGNISKNNSTFSTSSKQLSEDFAFLVRSLGIRDTVTTKEGKYRDKNGNIVECNTSYQHYLSVPNDIQFFTSEKHSKKYKGRQNPALRKITDIQYIGKEKCQCIMIDHPDHTYISDDFIPTHNTTSARIFSDMINKGEGVCIEIDAASNSGVDNIRTIIDEAHKKPITGEYKIFVIDEAHGLSSSAWQSMLKLLEEPPKTAIFILCTTNPEKIPRTIISRVQRFQFSKLSNDGIQKRLIEIIENEGNIQYEEEAIDYIVKSADGGMRDALTLLDECISLSSNITLDNVIQTIGGVDYDIYFDFLEKLVNKDKECISIVTDVYNSGKDLKLFLKEFSKFLLEVQKYKLFNSFKYIIIPTTYKDKLDALPENFTNQIKLIVSLNNDLKWDNDPKTLLELSLILYCNKK